MLAKDNIKYIFKEIHDKIESYYTDRYIRVTEIFFMCEIYQTKQWLQKAYNNI